MSEEESNITYYTLTDEEHEKLCTFIQKGFKDSLRKYLEQITLSAKNENRTVVLSEKTFNPNPHSTRVAPLALAALEGRIAILELFLEVFNGFIDVNHGSYLQYPDLYFLDMKMIHGCSTRGVTALNAASVSGLTDIVKRLIKAGASLNKEDHFGYSPLGNAARYGRVETVEYLLRRGADVMHKTHDGYTPMHLAALHGQHAVVEIMLKKMISPLFPSSKQSTQTSSVPCPLYLAAANGWQPVVDVFMAHETCPSFCKLNASLLLGAAARMFWRNITDENKKGIVDIWINARKQNSGGESSNKDVIPVPAYSDRKELIAEEDLTAMSESPNFEEESLYQCLLIHERCLGRVNTYNWIFLAGMKMFERKHYKEAETLWKRAMEIHYQKAQEHVGSDSTWQHDLKGTIEYMIKFSSSLETMVKDGYTPMWEEYIDYALQQLKVGILTSLQSNLLDTSSGVIKIYYCLLQIFSCWVDTEVGQPKLPLQPANTKVEYSEALQRAGQSFVDTASVLTQSNLLHIAIYPSPPLYRGTRWQSPKRISGLLLALLNFGSLESINDLDHNGNRPLHVAAKLPNKPVREAVISVLLSAGAHPDSFNRHGMTPREVFKVSYPNSEQCFPHEVPKLSCLVAKEIAFNGIEYDGSSFSAQVREVLQLHSLGINQAPTVSSWITLPNF